MTLTEILAIVLSVLSGVVGVTSLVTFASNRKSRSRDEGATDAIVNTSLDAIKLQNETLLQGNRQICDKLDNQNVRLSKLEQTVDNARLCEIPKQIATIEASVKSAHCRIDDLKK